MSKKNRSFADDGWAVWIDGNDTSTVYINDWINPKKGSYVDFAVRVRGIQESASLNIYIPFLVSEEEIEDASLRLSEEKILRAIFSSACIFDYMKNKCTSEIAYNGRTIDLIHTSVFGLKVKHLAEGTLVSVDIDAIKEYLDNDEGYFLLRFPHKSLDETFRKYVNVKSALTRFRDLITSPMVVENYGYQVRINEARALPAEINRIGAFHRQKLKKAIVTISVSENYSLNDSGCHKMRRLEKELYEKFVPKGFVCDDAITYQWIQRKEENLKGQFNFFFDISKGAVNKLSMFVYMVILLILGAAGNALWDLCKFILGWL